MLGKAEVLALCRAEHGDPFAALGMHRDGKGQWWLRALQPGANAVLAVDAASGAEVAELKERRIDALGGASGFFEAALPADISPFRYRLRVVWPGGVQEIDDPYGFPAILGDLDVWLLAEGSHL